MLSIFIWLFHLKPRLSLSHFCLHAPHLFPSFTASWALLWLFSLPSVSQSIWPHFLPVAPPRRAEEASHLRIIGCSRERQSGKLCPELAYYPCTAMQSNLWRLKEVRRSLFLNFVAALPHWWILVNSTSVAVQERL